MTDTRLPEDWLNQLRMDDLSDTAWRVFTRALMWCNANGTDGFVPDRYAGRLHPDGRDESAMTALAAAGLWHRTEGGWQFVDWDGVLGQSTALQVETNKANARDRARRYRESQRQKVAADIGFVPSKPPSFRDGTGDVTSSITRDVGEGTGAGMTEPPTDTHAREGEAGVASWEVASIPGGRSCAVCGVPIPGDSPVVWCGRQDSAHLNFMGRVSAA